MSDTTDLKERVAGILRRFDPGMPVHYGRLPAIRMTQEGPRADADGPMNYFTFSLLSVQPLKGRALFHVTVVMEDHIPAGYPIRVARALQEGGFILDGDVEFACVTRANMPSVAVEIADFTCAHVSAPDYRLMGGR